MFFATALLLFVCVDARTDVVEHLRAGRQRDAAEVMMLLLEEEPTNRELRSDLVKLEMRIGRYAAALEHAEPLGEVFNAMRGKALYLLGRYDEALVFLESDDAGSILFRHEALRALARFEEASQALEQAARLLGKDNVEVCVRRGQALARENKFDLAVQQFRSALERDPLCAAAVFGLGRALIPLGKQTEGLTLLEQHRSMTPLLDDLDFARRNLELDLSHAPNHAAVGDAIRALIPFDAALLSESRTAYARATELATGLEITPIALRYARLLEEELQEPAQAARVLEAAFAARKSARLAVRAGDIWMRASMPAEALVQFTLAQELRPKDAVIAERMEAARDAVAAGEAPR